MFSMEKNNKTIVILFWIFFGFIFFGVMTFSADLIPFDDGKINSTNITNFIKVYNETTKTITISNDSGLKEDISKIKLNTDWCKEENNCRLETPNGITVILPVGYQKVAEFEVELFDDTYTDAFDKIEFYNNLDNKLIERQFDYKYWGQEEIDVNDWKEVCEGKFINGTEICNLKIVGTKKETVWNWINFDTKNLIKGKITIGIFTEVYMGDNVEWIPTLFGKEINEWASFVQSSGTQTFIDMGGVNYTVMTFTSNGTFNVTGDTLNVSVLVIAGGGPGRSGGGGAGGLIYYEEHDVIVGNYDVVVGIGGKNSTGGIGETKGQNSSFDGLIAFGGGIAGAVGGAGGFGGSGAGAGGNSATGGTGLAGQGNNGGGGLVPSPYSAGGGGGAGAVGGTGVNPTSGNGGVGLTYTINGTSHCWAGGGGGGTGNGAATPGNGACGGGDGNNAGGISAINGTGSGGGGGGSNAAGGRGGDGVVIIRYLTPVVSSITTTLNSPSNTVIWANFTVPFNASATTTGAISVKNMTLNLWFSNGTAYKILTNTTTGTANTTTWGVNLVQDSSLSYIWNVLSASNVSETDWATNYTLSVGLNLSGTLKYGNGTAVNLGTVIAIYEINNTFAGKTNSTSDGSWSIGALPKGNYLITGYYRQNISIDGDVEAHVSLP